MRFTQVLKYDKEIESYCESHKNEAFGYDLNLCDVRKTNYNGSDLLLLYLKGNGEAYKKYIAESGNICVIHGFCSVNDLVFHSQKIQGVC